MTVAELIDELTRLVDEQPHAADAHVQARVGSIAGITQRVEWRGGEYVDLLDAPHPITASRKALCALIAEASKPRRPVEDVDTGGVT